MRGIAALILLLALPLSGCTDSEAIDRQDAGSSLPPVEPVVPQPAPGEPVVQADQPQEIEAGQQPANPEAAPASPETVRSLDELLLFFPSRFPAGNWQPENLKFEDVWFHAQDGTQLHGWYCPSENPRAVVLFAHGNAGNLSHRAWLLSYFQQRMHLSVMIFDYRGYGRSAGTPTAKGILEDGRAAATKLAELASVKESELVLMGRSLGGAVVVPLAVETNARGLIVQSTFSSLKDVAAFHYPKLSWVVPEDKLNSASLISEYNGPLLQSHGNADQVISFTSGQKLFTAANEPKQWITIPGGDHNDSQTPEYYRQLNAFIDQLPKE